VHLVDETNAAPVTSLDQLRRYFVEGEKPVARWMIGTEHELVGVLRETGAPPTYEGPRGIRALMSWFAARGWTPVHEGEATIALTSGMDQLTIEPGGQFELASRPMADDRDFATELRAYVGDLAEASRELGLAWLSTGLRPLGGRDAVPWMPKLRYDVMRAYMPTVGSRGLDMMLRTATVQSNLDFADEQDAARKMRCVYSVSSILTALWAASPIVDGVVSGYQSYRAHIWRDTDNARAGLLPLVFERDDIFTAYTEWALDVPMYFVYRGGYLPAPPGFTFRRFLAEGWRGERATDPDWALHLSTLFPEGRLKRLIEIRGCDCGSIEMIIALAPFSRGLLYDRTACEAAIALTAGMSFAERQELANLVPRQGLAAAVGRWRLGDLARELVAIARDGLGRVAPTAVPLIAAVEEIATTGRTQADEMIERWRRSPADPVAQALALAHPGLG
jgi:glutamate--cysteine ligase